jgi:hypothetical protein
MRFRKNVLGQKSKLLNLSNAGKTFSEDALLNNLQEFLSTESSDQLISEDRTQQRLTESSIASKETRAALLKQAVEIRKKKACPHSHEPKAKRKKLSNLVGQRILHKWELAGGKEEWIPGTVVNALDSTSAPDCNFEVRYDDSSDLFEVPLYEDLEKKEVVVLGSV